MCRLVVCLFSFVGVIRLTKLPSTYCRFKVNGVRGSRVVGSAGDFRGSQKVDVSERDTDVADGRFRVTTVSVNDDRSAQLEKDETTVRESLRFFFSPEGQVFRDFMLEELVTVVDASSRDAVQELTRTLGLGGIPVPSLFRALNPKLTENDRKVSFQ